MTTSPELWPAVELARRSAASNRGTRYGEALSRLAQEIEEDQVALRRVLGELGVGRDRIKLIAAWTAEKFGRLKLNGSLLAYSPLSRVVELEVLILGVEGKLLLWQALAEVKPVAERLGSFDIDELIRGARSQLRRLRRERLRAAAEALG